MIFNHCIYGSVSSNGGILKCTYMDRTLETIISKEYEVTEKLYQFNLGDSNIKGINSSITSGDIIILEYTEDDVKTYSDKCILDLSNNIQEFNIDIDENYIETDDGANFNTTEQVIKTSNYKIEETSTDIYSYYKIEDTDDEITVYDGNSDVFWFVPTLSHKYKISQKSINKTSNILSEKSYEFNAIMAAATITRSNKCKGINDSIKILFMGNDINTPNIQVYKNDEIDETGSMALEGDTLFSYNYVFSSEGHYLFRIDYNGESFITDFRVKTSSYKPYYIDENFFNETVSYELYFINDLNTVVDSGNFTHLDNGLYTTNEMNIDYGDYLFKIKGEEFVASFDECAPINTDNGTGITGTSSQEEIYWIFPNNIGD